MSDTTKSAPVGPDATPPGGSGSDKKKRRTVILGVAAAVVVVALAVVIIILQTKPTEVLIDDVPIARGVVAIPDNIDELRAMITEPVKDGYYETCMNTEWVFSTWDTPSDNAFVENALSNTRTVYIDVKLKDSDELVYSSPYIPVGATLTDFALDASVKAGQHDAIVTYNLVDDEYNEITTLSVAVKLYLLA